MNKETLQEYNTRLSENNTSLDDVLTAINNLPERGTGGGKVNEGVVLFEGNTKEDITLSDNINNYQYLEIYFKDNTGFYNYVKIYKPNNNTKAVLTIIECNDSDNYFMNYKSKNITISDNAIANQYYGEINFKLSNKSINYATRTNSIYITTVIGYK